MTNVPGTIYLIHFAEPYKHARHYLGWAHNLDVRIAAHRAGNGARLMSVIAAAGIDWQVVRTWPGVTRHVERRMKRSSGSSRYCPTCRESGSYHR
jgi:predicted GIY-YIG superfamily endonuclease